MKELQHRRASAAASRRRALSAIAGAGALGALGATGLLGLSGCGGGDDTETSSTTTPTTITGSTGTVTTTPASCSVVPEETAGPYPADGSTASNTTYNVLALAGIVRSDIRSSIGSSTQVGGVPLTLTLTLTNASASCASLAGYAIYLWHCSREGTYSVYSTSNVSDNALRGVQETNASGQVTFTTIVPGCYAGRMPHMHLEVYPSLAKATTASNKVKTTQLAFPTETLRTVYSTATGYTASLNNLGSMSFASDNVFSDGTDLEMTTLTGSVSAGYTANISIAIAA